MSEAERIAAELATVCAEECKGDSTIAFLLVDRMSMSMDEIKSRRQQYLAMPAAEKDEMTMSEKAKYLFALCNGDTDKVQELLGQQCH
jgi:hypothetical protein